MTPAKIYPFSIPAGGSFPLLVIGDYCKILTSSGALTLTGDTFGTIGPILAGQGVENSPFQRLVLTDQTGAVNNGTILIADNKFIDDRITGEVSVIDGEKVRTLSNGMFSGTSVTGIVAGQYPMAQLWNPVGTGKNIILLSMEVGAVSANLIGIGFVTAAFANDVTAGSAGNKKAGAAIGVAQVRIQNSVTPNTTQIKSVYVPSNQTIAWPIKGAIVLPPGYGIFAQNNIATNVAANFEWFEEAVV